MSPRKCQPKSQATPIGEVEWNFDRVPDAELVACCYWEYARESAFIREVRRRCLENWRAGGKWDLELHTDIQKVQSIEYPALVFLEGFFFEPDDVYQSTDENAPHYRHPEAPPITGSFPKPWQELTQEERACRAHVRSDRTAIPLVPFERGHAADAKDIVEWVSRRQKQLADEHKRIRQENPELSEEALCRAGKLRFPEIRPSIFRGGEELTVVAIDWGQFTNDEIVNYFRRWAKANRQKKIKGPSQRGHKPGDWRAHLTRLAVMRLLARFTPLELVADEKFPLIWTTKQFSTRKWGDITKWHDARREAGRRFRSLFPFLPPDEKPLSWQRQTTGK